LTVACWQWLQPSPPYRFEPLVCQSVAIGMANPVFQRMPITAYVLIIRKKSKVPIVAVPMFALTRSIAASWEDCGDASFWACNIY
jgi:hypothetical protein